VRYLSALTTSVLRLQGGLVLRAVLLTDGVTRRRGRADAGRGPLDRLSTTAGAPPAIRHHAPR
jgi:hypothetical protein